MGIRRVRRNWYMVLGVFVAVFAFVFLAQKFDGDEVEAANFGAFDPGYIISDYQMTNYTSMNEGQIQSFLKSKNGCNNTATWQTGNNIDHYREATPYSWHVAGGHYVCMADENINGESAAHIIWRAAQDYRINPKVLIVLLQKEQQLVEDSLPNSVQYRSATGYGCPDTAACSSQYYGFKNQVRKAAALFREVMDGGWSNYPVGWNYVRYAPGDCGGSNVNIRNRATSALYRYTPYQPNSAALSVPMGQTVYCGAYGNKNFYGLFEDWFGGVKSEGYTRMSLPRWMKNKNTGEVKYYSFKRNSDGGLCLSDDENNGFCTLFRDLTDMDWDWQPMETPRYMVGKQNSIKRNLTGSSSEINLNGAIIYYNKKVTLPDGRMCLKPENSKYKDWCAVFDTMNEADLKQEAMNFPRLLEVREEGGYFVDPNTRKKISRVDVGEKYTFEYKIYLPDIGACLVTDNKSGCILRDDLLETWNPMEYERVMVVTENSYKVDVDTNKSNYSVLMNKGMERKFITKTYYNGGWCLRTEYDDNLGNDTCVPLNRLGEVWNLLDQDEEMTIKANSRKIDALNLRGGLLMLYEDNRTFTSKYYVASKGQWCYKTEYDTDLNTNYCFLESDIRRSSIVVSASAAALTTD